MQGMLWGWDEMAYYPQSLNMKEEFYVHTTKTPVGHESGRLPETVLPD